ncbi:DUF1059 domain-containing protein [Jiella endophytica]|uniref:DUF1059 domain-containing protein n=1 Tax=Jiella endophytica TaxID=2558362 RepID=A0A4Y8RE35_9HYPH|nr:DUF1059 domain-containing protein [Jiella endophytica]TFF20481.1 DUF1059 domain-containing protein [Jiella endophytica]
MYELDCSAVFPGCGRVIRADTKAGVIRRAIAQANALGIEHISPSMMDSMREKMVEKPETGERAA